jgi:hypothetical protein
MNVIEYVLRDYYKRKLYEYYTQGLTPKKLRSDLQTHGCHSAQQTCLPKGKNGSPGDHIWTLKAFNKNLVYKVNTRKYDIDFVGVR